MLPSLWGRRWVRYWASSLQGQKTLEELLDLGYILDPPPISGGALDFPDNGGINRGGVDDAALDVADSVSVLVQVLVTSDTNNAVDDFIAGKRANLTTAQGYALFETAAEDFVFEVNDATDEVRSTAFARTINTWYAMTGYLQANAAADDDVGLYNDDNQAAEVNSTVLGTLANTAQFTAGVNPSGGNNFDGKMAYVRVWKKSGAWTQSELDRFVEARNRIYLPAGWAPGGTMELQWILWETTLTTARDYSGNGRTGTYTGATAVATDPARVVGPGGSPQYRRTVVAAAGGGRRQMLRGLG